MWKTPPFLLANSLTLARYTLLITPTQKAIFEGGDGSLSMRGLSACLTTCRWSQIGFYGFIVNKRLEFKSTILHLS